MVKEILISPFHLLQNLLIQWLLVKNVMFMALVLFLMGKHPKELLTLLSLSPSSMQSILLKDILDLHLTSPQNQRVAGEIILIGRMALKCIHVKPQFRPTMQEVCLELLVSKLFTLPFDAISLSQLRDQEV